MSEEVTDIMATYSARGQTRRDNVAIVSGRMNSYEAAYEYGADMLRLGNWFAFQVEKHYVLGAR